MKLCKGECAKWLPLESFRSVKGYSLNYCRACCNARDIKRAAARRARVREEQRELRGTLKVRREAAIAVLAPIAKTVRLPKVRNELQQKIEQVIARVDTGDSIEFAAWRVGIPVEVVRAWTEAA